MYFWAMSDRGIPRSYRMMQGFGVNTFTLINAKGERSFVKFHFTPELGVHSLVWDEALKLAGQDPDFHRKDLWEAIDNGAFPVWKFGIQVIPESKEHDFDFDILDATKVWPEDLVPVRYIGELTLNRNVDEYFTETEQVAFCTSHVVPGIGFSDDPLLQGRNFSYLDTQLSRLGINFQELPINRPVCPVMNVNRDGAMRHTISRGTVNYYPNRFDVIKPASTEEGAYVDYAQKLAGVKARAKSDKFKEYVAQAQLFYNSMSEVEKTHIVNALAFELDHVDEPLVYSRIAERLAEIDINLARTVAEKVGADPPKQTTNTNKGHRAPGLSQFDFIPKNPTIVSRRVAILISDGFDSTAFTAMKTAVASAMATPMVIGIKRGMIPPASGSPVKPDHHFEGYRSTMVDALFIPGGKGSAATLRTNGRAVHWIREAFGHLKAIGATGEGVQVVRDVLGVHQLKTSSATDVVESYGVVTLETLEANSISEAWEAAKSGKGFVDQFFTAISQHRCWARETDGLNSLVAY
jgi:catalase